MKSFVLRVAAILSPLLAATLLAVPAHAAPFAVFAPEPTQTFVNQDTTFHSDLTDGVAVIDHCNFSVDGVSHGAMTVFTGPAGKSAYLETSISTPGSRTVRVTCYNASESSSVYNENAVTVFNDTAAPGVGAFTLAPVAPVAGSPVTIQTNYDDTDFGSGIDNCSLYVDGAFISLMNLSGGSGSTAGTASRDHTFATGGSYSVKVDCADFSGNVGTRTQTVAVTAPPDTTAPSVAQISAISPTQNVATTISATYSDNVGVTSCKLFVNDFDWGTMNLSGSLSGTASKSFAFNPSGTHYVYVACFDAGGNDTIGPTRTVTVAVASTDTTPPVVTAIHPSVAALHSAVTISASFSDAVGVVSCDLYANDVLVGNMDRSGTTSGTATRSHTFTTTGNHYLRVSCRDAAGNIGNAAANIDVTGDIGAPVYANELVKLVCPAGFIDVNHPCKAVYYVGSDGKRHAFPNERVYFTWYSNFDGVLQLSGAQLSAITLGSNVNYRPGMRMVKFTTVNRVYAVGRYGTLRWVTSESAASALYGSAWNTRIDDINDAFFTDYSFGADINSSSDFNPTVEAATVANIDANLR